MRLSRPAEYDQINVEGGDGGYVHNVHSVHSVHIAQIVHIVQNGLHIQMAYVPSLVLQFLVLGGRNGDFCKLLYTTKKTVEETSNPYFSQFVPAASISLFRICDV